MEGVEHCFVCSKTIVKIAVQTTVAYEKTQTDKNAYGPDYNGGKSVKCVKIIFLHGSYPTY